MDTNTDDSWREIGIVPPGASCTREDEEEKGVKEGRLFRKRNFSHELEPLFCYAHKHTSTSIVDDSLSIPLYLSQHLYEDAPRMIGRSHHERLSVCGNAATIYGQTTANE